jgi:hypothetical protein
VTAALPAAPVENGRSWLHVLVGAVRPEFRAEVYVPAAVRATERVAVIPLGKLTGTLKP